MCRMSGNALNMHPRYTLPECHHTFHIHCIIAWFRCSVWWTSDGVVGGRCPCCGDRGVNSATGMHYELVGIGDGGGGWAVTPQMTITSCNVAQRSLGSLMLQEALVSFS